MTTIERYILKLLLVPAMMLPLSLAAADETPQQQADRAAEQARIANANAQVALEAARRAQEFADAARREAEAAAQAVRRADSL